MGMTLDSPSSHDVRLARYWRRRMTNHQVGMDPRHRVRIACLSNADDEAIANADVAFNDPCNGVDDRGILDYEIECTIGVFCRCAIAFTVAKSFSSTDQ